MEKYQIDEVIAYKYLSEHFVYSPLSKLVLKISKEGFDCLRENQTKEYWDSLLEDFNIFSYSKPNVYEYISDNQFEGVNLLMTNACNLACKYCYASKSHESPDYIAKDKWKAIVDYALKNRSAKTEEFSLAFHGFGECSLKFSEIEKIVDYFKVVTKKHDLKPLFQITTNGTFNPKDCDFLIENNFRINISLDGIKEINDEMRISKNGNSVFDLIVGNLKKIAKSKVRDTLLVRATVTSEGVKKLKESLQFLIECGVKLIHFAPIDMRGAAENLPISYEADINTFVEEFLECVIIASNNNVKLFYAPFNFGVGIRFCSSKGKLTGDYLGRILGCVEAGPNSGLDIFTVGKIDNSRVDFDNVAMEILNSKSVYDYIECQTCLLKYHCAGDCLVSRLERNNNKKDSSYYCESVEKGFAWILKDLSDGCKNIKSLLDFPVEQLL